MKKVFMLLAVAGFIVSCDNAADTEKRLKDSTDSAANAQKEAVEEGADKKKDSIEQNKDAKIEMIDSMDKKNDSAR